MEKGWLEKHEGWTWESRGQGLQGRRRSQKGNRQQVDEHRLVWPCLNTAGLSCAPSLGTGQCSALTCHSPAALQLHLLSSPWPSPLALWPLGSLPCPFSPCSCGNSAPPRSNVAPHPSASSELQHLAQAGWRQEQKLWASPKMLVARCAGISVWGRCFPHSSSKEASEGLQGVQGSKEPFWVHQEASPGCSPGLGGASPLLDAADLQLWTPAA